jgi:hypothetical protein
MRFIVVLGLLVGLTSVTDSQAQDDFSSVNLKPGDLVYVIDPSGTEVSGRVTTLTPSSISLTGYTFRPEPGLRIDKWGDPIWDGGAIGFGLGLGIGALLASGECGVDWPAWKCMLASGAWGAGLGTLIDVKHRGRTRVFVGTGAPVSPATRSESRRVGRLTSVRLQFSF